MNGARRQAFGPSFAWLPVSFALVMLDGYDMLIVSFLAPLIAEDLHLGATDLGALFAAGLAGSMAGSMVLGVLADRWGRRPIVVIATAAAGIATILCAQAAGSHAFMLLRFVSGVALGGALAALIPLFAESCTMDRRSARVTARCS